MSGVHTITVAGIDISCLVDTISIAHGRDDSAAQPEASAATIALTSDPIGPLPPEVDVGAALVVTTSAGLVTSDRFVGRITDISLGWDEAGEDTPDTGVGQIVAVGPTADLGRRVVGEIPWPQELDGARVARVMAAAGVTLDPLYSDPGTVQILPRDVDSTAALDAARDAATSASGVVWETRSGEIRYADAAHRRGIPQSLALDACDLLVSPSWRRNLDGLVNDVSIGYGISGGDEGEQPRYVEADAASIARWGHYGYTSATDLAELVDAQTVARLLLARNSSPVWVMVALPVDVEGLDAARYEALLGLDVHSLLVLTGLPAIGTAPTEANLWVEGYREGLSYGAHEIELVVSGYCRTAPPPRWDDVDPGWLWGTTTSALTRTNLSIAPVAAPAGGGWLANDGARHSRTLGVAVADHPLGITTALRMGPIGAAVGTTTIASLYNPDGLQGTTTARGVGVWVKSPWPARVRVSIYPAFLDTDIPANVWTFCTSGAVAPSYAGVYVDRLSGVTAAGDTVLLTGSIAEAGTIPPDYFDGNSPDTASRTYAWTGTPAASSSTLTERVDSPGGLPPDLTWDGAACLGPPTSFGRWNDQPATLRWNQIAPATTWNSYR